MPVATPEAEYKPPFIGVGEITDVSPHKKTESGVWDMFVVEITGAGASYDTKKYLLYTLDMFQGVDPCKHAAPKSWSDPTLTPEEKASKVKANFFRDNVAPKKGFLYTVLGDDYATFLEALDALGGSLTVEDVAEIAGRFLMNRPVIYDLKQGTEKQEDGTKARTEFYEVKQVVALTEENMERALERARKGDTRAGFEVPVEEEAAVTA